MQQDDRTSASDRIKGSIHWMFYHLGRTLDRSIRFFRRVLRLQRRASILPYVCYGRKDMVKLMGRVIEDQRLPQYDPRASALKNALGVIRRFVIYDLAQAKLRATVGDKSASFESDDEGYFFRDMPIKDAQFGTLGRRHTVTYDVLAVPQGRLAKKTYNAEILFPGDEARFGVISDIDDTIMRSHATSAWRLYTLTLFRNVFKREPVSEAAEFYRTLRDCEKGNPQNPFFYVSSSGWNLYDFLDTFISTHEFPRGAIVLRHLGLDRSTFFNTEHSHKLVRIREILMFYPDLPFVLIGDAGQRDPYLYMKAAKEFGERILAVYIRKIPGAELSPELLELGNQARAAGTRFVYFDTPSQAIAHAREHGILASGSYIDT